MAVKQKGQPQSTRNDALPSQPPKKFIIEDAPPPPNFGTITQTPEQQPEPQHTQEEAPKKEQTQTDAQSTNQTGEKQPGLFQRIGKTATSILNWFVENDQTDTPDSSK